MEYIDLKNYVIANFMKNLEKHMNLDEAEFVVKTVNSINIEKHDVISIAKPGQQGFPIIMINDIFKRYQRINPQIEDEFDVIEHLISKLAEQYAHTVLHMTDEELIGNNSYDISSGRLRILLVEYERNRELLQTCPHRRFLNLAVLYCLEMSPDKCVIITESTASQNKITEEELYLRSYQRLEVSAVHIDDKYYPEPLASKISAVNMSAISTEDMQLGASAILVRPLLRKIADSYGTNLFLLPSSIHEFLILPDDGCITINREEQVLQLYNMVKEVNKTTVDVKDILTTAVYYYDREKAEVSILQDNTSQKCKKVVLDSEWKLLSQYSVTW